MPELPEVEVVRRGLEKNVTGRRVCGVRVLRDRPVRWDGPQAFRDAMLGRTLLAPRRRGKYLWFPFDDGDAMLAHLGMSGQFRIDDPGSELAPNTRVIFDLDDGRQLRFVDQRMFGGLQFSAGGAELPQQISHIALDPFDEEFDIEATVAKIRAKRSTIKRAILDQGVISGIGNIYADESLWRARTHYDFPTQRLTAARARRVLETAKDVMADSLLQGGTSFDELYVDINGSSGYFSRSLNVYGQEGKACTRCGTKIRRDAFMNRSSYLCPKCQRLPKPLAGKD